jgi:glycosyltransferase involved in cell wall biosynthesis
VKILHLLGDTADLGGILSVVRCLHEMAAPWEDHHVAWVHRGYRETRQPPLIYRYSRWLKGEAAPHLEFLLRAGPALFELLRLLRKEPFDVVHAHSRGAFPVAALLSGLTRRPVVFTNHTYATRTTLYRWAARIPSLHTVVLTANMARHYQLQAPSPRVSIISECCRELFFAGPPRERPTPADPTAPVRLVGVGNIVRWKKWHVLLDALAMLDPLQRTRLQFAHWGQAPSDRDSRAYERELQDRIHRANLASTVRFHGPTLEVMAKLFEADWFVLPSTNEPCSVALIEALALGRPALVSASGGNVDIIVPDQTGLLFAPDDPADLARQLRHLLSPGLNIASSATIRQSVAVRHPAQVTRQYRELYEHVAQAGRGRRAGSPQSAVPDGAPEVHPPDSFPRRP